MKGIFMNLELQRPRVLMISGALNFGGPGKIAEQIGVLAQNSGYEVLVAHSSRNENPSNLPHFSVTTKYEEMWHALGAKFLDLHGLLSVAQTRQLVTRIREFSPDIIHLHNIHGYYLNFKILFEYLNTVDIPVVWTLHDCWSFTGRCFHFEGIGCEKWRYGCCDCGAEKGYTVSPFYDRSQQLYELKRKLFSSVKDLTLVPVSNWLSGFVCQSFLKNCEMRVIQNGIDLEVFHPMNGDRLRVKHKLNGKFVILGVAAPWNKRKGLDDFFVLRKLLPDSFAIVLVGLSQKQVKCLPDGIIGVNRTQSQAELAEYYSMADIFCNMTYLDTFPTVNLEALACGTPVITYKTGGSPEALDENTGIVISQGDVVALADSIKAFKNNAKFNSTVCRRRAETHFDKNLQFQKYIDLYNQIIQSQK